MQVRTKVRGPEVEFCLAPSLTVNSSGWLASHPGAGRFRGGGALARLQGSLWRAARADGQGGSSVETLAEAVHLQCRIDDLEDRRL